MNFDFEAILLDFDGTLADTEAVKMKALAAFLAEKNILQFDRKPGDSSSQIIRNVFSESHTKEEAEVFATEFHSYQAQYMDKNLTPEDIAYADVIPFITKLEILGIKKTIVTTSNREVITVMGAKSGITKFFPADLIVTKNDVPPGMEKPNAKPYTLAAELLGVDPNKCLALEDSKTGILSAQSAGCAVAIVNREENDFTEFETQFAVRNLSELEIKLGL
jgi:HAD superfamily hydrolase (TIGR01509 family)